MTAISLALRLLKRDWRSGHLNLILVALLVAVTTHTTIGFHSERISNAMQVQGANLMGGEITKGEQHKRSKHTEASSKAHKKWHMN